MVVDRDFRLVFLNKSVACSISCALQVASGDLAASCGLAHLTLISSSVTAIMCYCNIILYVGTLKVMNSSHNDECILHDVDI